MKGQRQLSEYPFYDLLTLSTLTLATASPEGKPHAVPVYFVALMSSQGEAALLRIYFFSELDSRHSRDISATSLGAAAIYPDTHDWGQIRGLQMHGRVHPVPDGVKWERAWQGYLKKFPFVGELKEVVAKNTLYVFTPTWVRMVDNRQGFGYKQEWSFLNERA